MGNVYRRLSRYKLRGGCTYSNPKDEDNGGPLSTPNLSWHRSGVAFRV